MSAIINNIHKTIRWFFVKQCLMVNMVNGCRNANNYIEKGALVEGISVVNIKEVWVELALIVNFSSSLRL